MDNSRREFIQLVVYFGVGTAVAACGDDAAPGPPDCSANGGKATAISGNHGHVLAVPVADFGGGDHTYDIEGTGGHNHTITLSAAQLTDIMALTQVVVQSTETVGGSPAVLHSHMVTVGCSTGRAGGGGGGY